MLFTYIFSNRHSVSQWVSQSHPIKIALSLDAWWFLDHIFMYERSATKSFPWNALDDSTSHQSFAIPIYFRRQWISLSFNRSVVMWAEILNWYENAGTKMVDGFQKPNDTKFGLFCVQLLTIAIQFKNTQQQQRQRCHLKPENDYEAIQFYWTIILFGFRGSPEDRFDVLKMQKQMLCRLAFYIRTN